MKIEKKHFAYMGSFVPSLNAFCGRSGKWQGRTPNLEITGKIEDVTRRGCIKVIKAKLKEK
jgi:hypothetical protein